ncbi:MAG: response regulator [Flavobacteriales bacterium]|nr:response regulator [Flavobacteriales bacterium]
MKWNFLIVEDDKVYAMKLSSWLKEYDGEIELCETAERGAHVVATKQPTIVFLDNKLPKLDGREVVRYYKELSPKTVIIMMSTAFTIEDISESKENGADFLFDKLDTDKDDIGDILDVVESSKGSEQNFWNLWPRKKS